MDRYIQLGFHLKEIETLRQKALDRYQVVLSTEYNPVLEAGAIAKTWWGYRTKGHKVLFTYYGNNSLTQSPHISWDHVGRNDANDIITTPYEDLPLRVNDPLDEGGHIALKGILSGKRSVIPHNQALTDAYFRADRHLEIYSKFACRCSAKIEEYVVNKAYELYPKQMRYQYNLTFTFTINGRVYTVITNTGRKPITIYPESTIHHLTEEDLLKDEQSQPLIHGVRSYRLETCSEP